MKATRIGQTGTKQGTGTKGKFSTVYKVLMKEQSEGDMNVAVKEYVLPSQKDNEEARALVEGALTYLIEDFEQALIEIPAHPHLARYYGLEYLPGLTNGNLDRVLLTCDWVDNTPLKGPMDEARVRDIIAGATKGLAHLHKQGISHDDIRPVNILVTNIWRRRNPGDAADKTHAVLTDYSLFKKINDILDPEGGNATTKQSPNFLAPEVFTDGKDYDALKVDVWAMAATALTLLAGKEPWTEFGNGNNMFKIISANKPPKYPEGISPQCKAWLDACFDRDYRSRPSAEESLAMEWLQSAQ